MTAASRRRAALARHAALFVGALAVFGWTAACGRSSAGTPSGHGAGGGGTLAVAPDDPYVGPELADFELLDQRGQSVSRADLLGRPAIVDFVFTTCTGPCPAMSAGFAELQRELEGVAGGPRLVSLSVDPERDTIEVLAAYAEALGADPERWLFLTGEEAQVVACATSLYLAVQRAPDGEARLGEQVTHATKLVVLDAEGRVRGYYDGQSSEGRRAALARALHLAASS